MTHSLSLSTVRAPRHRTISRLGALLLAVAGNILVIAILALAAVMVAVGAIAVFGPALMDLL
ncbi:hypothetical protein ASD65_06355 [Microbacterium sp. Root61]|uniref:hypothetical protein n=1 Tax=Microbacterium sp. Root61 TaxID=1736570 RepID=UPI0007003383|nr:hypothetical protein [Microbacterium sp. Root61]KRA24087.1 hypothetical protein ASD65_06355 [Microbacterium sp. Root61]